MRRQPNTQTVAWFLELNERGQLDLDPPYQRRSVWNDEYRRFFIDTVLRNYPCPPIFLEVDTQPGRPTTYRVIDGKQRLSSLIGFSKDEFDTGQYLDDLNASRSYYSNLDRDMQTAFLEYIIGVENIRSASKTDLQSAFDRLNRNVAKLNDQELRNARFSGSFTRLMTTLADEDFWSNTGVSTTARIRRMLDIEYVSEIYVLTMHGIQDGKATLDEYYAKYDAEVPDQVHHTRNFRHVLGYLDSIPIDWKGTRWSNLADLYSLWAAILELETKKQLPHQASTAQKLIAFGERVGLENGGELEQRYLIAARQGSNKDSNRALRKDIILQVLQT